MDVLVVFGERGAGEPFHVFDDERFRLQDAQHFGGGWEHVARVCCGPMLAAEGERLAGRPACNQIYGLGDLGPVDAAHVTFVHIPAFNERIPGGLVFADRVASPSVPFGY